MGRRVDAGRMVLSAYAALFGERLVYVERGLFNPLWRLLRMTLIACVNAPFDVASGFEERRNRTPKP
jgi:hypothetical protein